MVHHQRLPVKNAHLGSIRATKGALYNKRRGIGQQAQSANPLDYTRWPISLIKLTKLDSTPILVNVEAIKYVEMIPDTLVLFLNGDSLLVKESSETLVAEVKAVRADILRQSNAQQ